MAAHHHVWVFTSTAAGWSAICTCGLAVAVEERSGGCSVWEWTLDGAPVPAELMLDGVSSVTQAWRGLLAARERAN